MTTPASTPTTSESLATTPTTREPIAATPAGDAPATPPGADTAPCSAGHHGAEPGPAAAASPAGVTDPAGSLGPVGLVLIGRNEGDRLARSLASLARHAPGCPAVYVDSGSTDGSLARAAEVGAEPLELDLARPFTAARARNAGVRRLLELHPGTRAVQVLDGDCELEAGWLDTARRALGDDPALAVVTGRRRERHPEASRYNRLIDLEWDREPGLVAAFGGDGLIRLAAFTEVGGFDESLIAGEEPELCFRLRARGWRIRRLARPMSVHDADLARFGQWWRRAVRAGHAAAEGAWLHARSPERYNLRRALSMLFWAGGLPAVVGLLAAVAVWAFGPAGLAVLGLVPVAFAALGLKVARAERRRGRSPAEARLVALFTVLGKPAEAIGVLRFAVGRATGRRSRLIEYKQTGPPPDASPNTSAETSAATAVGASPNIATATPAGAGPTADVGVAVSPSSSPSASPNPGPGTPPPVARVRSASSADIAGAP